MREVKVGLVGCGRNSENHLRVYSNTDRVRLVAVCDIDSNKAEEMAKKYGVQRTFTDFNSMLDLDLDLVDIVTPTPTHAKLSIRALKSGHNVLVEKPMAYSSKECLDMIEAARKNDKILCVMHNKRFFDSILKTKAKIEQENLSVTRIRVAQLFTGIHAIDWILHEAYGGLLWEALVHHIYLTQYFIGKIESVYTIANKIRQPVNDSITLIVQSREKVGLCEYESGMKEPLALFQIVTDKGDRFDGNLSHDFVVRKSRKYKNRKMTALRNFNDDMSEPLVKWTSHLRNFMQVRSFENFFPYRRTFFKLIRQLISYLLGEKNSPPVTAEEGLQTIRVLEAAKKSIETNKAEAPK